MLLLVGSYLATSIWFDVLSWHICCLLREFMAIGNLECKLEVSQVPLLKSFNICSCMTLPIKKMTPPNFSKFGKDFFPFSWIFRWTNTRCGLLQNGLKKFICGCRSLNKVLVQYFFAMKEHLVLFSFTSPPIEVWVEAKKREREIRSQQLSHFGSDC